MTRQEYMEQLKKYLKRLPKEDYENAIEYFSEYFDEAGLQKEQQVMKETFSWQDHSAGNSGSLCIASQPGTSGWCFGSSARSGYYRYSSDLFSWYHQHRGDSRRHCDGWFRSNTGSEICGSSMYDDRRRISDGRDRDSCRCSYYIYM